MVTRRAQETPDSRLRAPEITSMLPSSETVVPLELEWETGRTTSRSSYSESGEGGVPIDS